MLFGLLGFMFINLFTHPLIWLMITPELMLVQLLLFYYTIRLLNIKNYYQLLGYAVLFLITLSIYLFWLQFDVFSCFLLVAESIVMLFILTTLLHINYTNLFKLNTLNTWIPFLVILCLWQGRIVLTPFNYWVDWYESQTSQFSDLLPQFIFFYSIDAHIVPLIGLWLLILTFVLIYLILNISLSKNTSNSSLFYTKKIQNIWSQWYVKPFIRFFKK